MFIDNGSTEVNIAVVNFKANGEEFKYVGSIEDTEKFVKINYPFDVKFKKGKLYQITYETDRVRFDLESHEEQKLGRHTVNCGMCRLVCVENYVSNTGEIGCSRFIFKKIKSRR